METLLIEIQTTRNGVVTTETLVDLDDTTYSGDLSPIQAAIDSSEVAARAFCKSEDLTESQESNAVLGAKIQTIASSNSGKDEEIEVAISNIFSRIKSKAIVLWGTKIKEGNPIAGEEEDLVPEEDDQDG